jgi:hypothetical protein
MTFDPTNWAQNRKSPHDDIMAASRTAEADTLKEFIPDLVTAICDCVQSVSDQCLSKGLISDSTHERVLESRGTSKEQARTLILSVQNSTKTDEGCFKVFLDILNESLPYRVKKKLLPEMRKDLADHSGASKRKALIPAFQGARSFMVEDDRLQRIQQQGFLFGKYESSMKNYAHASAEKALYEESLENKTKEHGQLRSNLEVLKTQSSRSDVNSQEIDSAEERLSACEMEMAELKKRLEKIEGVIREEDMQARRGKSVIMVEAKMTEEQFAAALREKEEEYKRLLKEREDELRRRMEEEIRMKDLKHRVEIRETQLQVKELELRNARMTQETGSPAVLHDVSRIVPPPPIPWNSAHLVSSPLTTPPQLNVLLQELSEVASQWVVIGTLLGIQELTLTRIKLDNPFDCMACLRDMLKVWLHCVHPPPSWRAVIEALRMVGHERIAGRLETKYFF